MAGYGITDGAFSKTTSLVLPKNDNDKIETNLNQDCREAYEIKTNEEVPKLTTKDAILASDYFRYGWEAAIVKYSQQVVEHQQSIISIKTFDFSSFS